MSYKYTIKNGESPADVAQRYTGKRSAYRDLLLLNPRIEQTTGSMGAPLFVASAWRPGSQINVPASWTVSGPIHPLSASSGRVGCGRSLSIKELEELGLGLGKGRLGSGDKIIQWPQPTSSGPYDGPYDDPDLGSGERHEEETVSTSTSGTRCTPPGAEVTEVKPYQYVVQQEDIGNFWKIPGKFNMGTAKEMWQELRNANLDWVHGFVKNGEACEMANLYAGAKLKVPARWQEPKSGVKTVPFGSSGCPDGQTLVGGQCVDGVATSGGCPPGYVLNANGQCVESGSGVDIVSRTDSDSNTVWMLLAAGAAVVGGIYMYSARKGKYQSKK